MDQTYQFGGNLQYENVQAAQAPLQSHRKTFNHNEDFRVACSCSNSFRNIAIHEPHPFLYEL